MRSTEVDNKKPRKAGLNNFVSSHLHAFRDFPDGVENYIPQSCGMKPYVSYLVQKAFHNNLVQMRWLSDETQLHYSAYTGMCSFL